MIQGGLMQDHPSDAATVPTPRSDVVRPFQPHDLVAGRFRIMREIAEGGMGVVYEAIDEKLGERRALKCAKPGFAARLSPEARNALRVTHPNVCRVFEIHTTSTPVGDVDFITMEYLDGGTLSREIRARGALPEPEARGIAVQICAGLAAAHGQNVLHRDLKSNNVMLAADASGRRRAVVTDFGLAEEPRPTDVLPAWSDVAGTPAYLAPERWKGAPATIATDLYALGVVLHELIAGAVPAAADGFRREIAAGVPARWRAVIARCLDPDPLKRYGNAGDVADALTNRRARNGAIAAAVAAALALAAFVGYRTLVPAPIPARLAILAVEPADGDPQLTALARDVSADLSARLTRLRPRPRQVVFIPLSETRGIAIRDAARATNRLGATHALSATVGRHDERLAVHAAVVDTTTKVTLADRNEEYASADPAAIATALSTLVAMAFRLPAQQRADTVSRAAYASYAKGVAALQAGTASYPQAVAAFEAAIAADPRAVLPRARLVEAYYDAWQATADESWLARGAEELARAEAIEPDSLSVHLAGGRLHLVPGGYSAAAREYQRATVIDPESPEAWDGLGRAYEELPDRRNDAAAAYLKAAELQPGYFRPVNNLGAFYRRIGNLQDAEAQWLKAITMAPERFEGYSNIATLYMGAGRYAEAEIALKRAIEIEPRSRAAHNNLGAVYQYMGRDADAVAMFEQARTLAPETPTLMVNLGDSYRRLGHPQDAAAAYQRGRELAGAILLKDPGDAANRAFVAYLALRLGDRATADRELAQALSAAPADRSVQRRAVLCFEAAGRRDRSLALLQSAPADLLRELSGQPDLKSLRDDARFIALRGNSQP